MATQTENDRRETLRVQYAAVAARDIALGQWRFQAMVIFLAAAVLIAEHAAFSARALGSLLIVLSFGMLILDLRNRELVRQADTRRTALEEELGVEPLIVDRQRAENASVEWRFKSHTTVFDFAYGFVLGYGIAIFLPASCRTVRHGTWLIEGAIAFAVGVVLVSGMHQLAKRSDNSRNSGSRELSQTDIYQ